MTCSSSPSSRTTYVLGDTTCVRTVQVTQETFNTYSDPCAYLLSDLADTIKIDIDVPLTSSLSCSFVSVSVLSGGQKYYVWDVTATWTS